MIRMIATTISNSIREKPFCFFMILDLLEKFYGARARLQYGKREANLGIRTRNCSPGHICMIINVLTKFPTI
jgi:hypothetical protein